MGLRGSLRQPTHHSLSQKGSFHKDSCEQNRMILRTTYYTPCKCTHSWIKTTIHTSEIRSPYLPGHLYYKDIYFMIWDSVDDWDDPHSRAKENNGAERRDEAIATHTYVGM